MKCFDSPEIRNMIKGSRKDISENRDVVEMEVDKGGVEVGVQAPDHVPGEDQVREVAQLGQGRQGLELVIAQV